MISFLEYLCEDEKKVRKPLMVFDFDDTIAHAGSRIGVKLAGRRVRELTSLDFKNYKLAPGEEFDYSAADEIVHPKPIGAVLKVVRAVHRKGKPIVVLTGRSKSAPVEKWLEFIGLTGIKVVAIGHENSNHHSIAKAKFEWLVKAIATNGYDDVEFWDDNETNITYAKGLKKRFPNIRFRAKLVHYKAKEQ